MAVGSKVIPPQEILAVLVKPLNQPSPMSYPYQVLQSSLPREVGEVEFPVAFLTSGGTLSKEPAQGKRLAIQTTIRPHCNKLLTKPAFVPLALADSFPLAFGKPTNHFISLLCLRTLIPTDKNSKVSKAGSPFIATRAGDGTRTHDSLLGRQELYH